MSIAESANVCDSGGVSEYDRKSRRKLLLDEMEQIVPWSGPLALVRPRYAKASNGRRPVGLEVMLRANFVQQWFNLPDTGVEEELMSLLCCNGRGRGPGHNPDTG
jgi:hypothetical protein